MTTKQILVAARELIAKGWSGRTLARFAECDQRGMCAWDDPMARAFDASGAIFRVVGSGPAHPDVIAARRALADAAALEYASDLAWWNDEVGKEGVLKAYDEAIARLG